MSRHEHDQQPINREIEVPDWVKQADRVAAGVRSTAGLSMVAGQNVLREDRAKMLAEAWLRLRKLITDDDPKRFSADPADYRYVKHDEDSDDPRDGHWQRFEGDDWWSVEGEMHRIPPATREALGIVLGDDDLPEPELADDERDEPEPEQPALKPGDRAIIRGANDDAIRAIVTEGPKLIDGVPHYRADPADDPNAKDNPTWLAIDEAIRPIDDESWAKLAPKPPKN